MEKTCSIADPDQDLVSQLQVELGILNITARCLVARGICDHGGAKAFLDPRLSGLRSPIGLAGLADALPRLVQAAQAGETVGVFGDYDVDGVSTAALLSEAMAAFGAQVIARVANRQAGYGFSMQAATELALAGCTLIITGDCGTSDQDSIRAAAAGGADVIIIDHHTVPAANEPHPAFALINPFRADSTFPFRGMASVGLAFYVMGALRTELKKLGHFSPRRQEPDVCSWLDLVALGTVADLVPLSEENRIMTREGLRWLNLRRRPGVAALLEQAGVARSELVDERTIGWKLGPRLNAPGRLGDAQLALDVLRARDTFSAKAAASVVETINGERRAAQERVYEEALALLGDSDPGPAIVVAAEGWEHGVVGIIASRLVDKYERPALVIALDKASGEGRGSARSFGGVNLYDALASCGSLLTRFGGHAAAAGVTMDGKHLGALRMQFAQAVALQDKSGVAHTFCDAELFAEDIDEYLALELKTLAPFGKGNEEPLLMSRNVEVKDSRRVGDGSHLKLTLRDSRGRELSAIAFGLGEKDPGAGARIDLAYVPAITTWMGRKRLELSVKHIWAASLGAARLEPGVVAPTKAGQIA